MFLPDYSARAMAMVRGQIPDLLEDQDKWAVLIPEHPRYRLELENQLLGSQFHYIRYAIDPSREEIARVVREIAARKCVLLTFRAMINKGQIALGEAIPENSAGLLVASEAPFEIAQLPSWQNALAMLDPCELAVSVLALVLMGKIKPAGKLPVRAN